MFRVKVQAAVQEAAPGVYQIALKWSRAYILTDGTNFSLVDSGTRWDRYRLLKVCAMLRLNPANCRSVLLTHGHPDHAGGAAYFAQTVGAKLCAHERERTFLETRRTYIPRDFRAFGAAGMLFALGEIVWPVRRRKLDVLLQNGDEVSTPAGIWRVLHTPGHTPGHVCFFREADGVLLSGDALLTVLPFNRGAGLTLPLPVFTSDLQAARRSTRNIIELSPQRLLPGHGAPLCENLTAQLEEFKRKL